MKRKKFIKSGNRAAKVRKTHIFSKAVSLASPDYSRELMEFFRNSLCRDLGSSGDISMTVLGGKSSRIVKGRIMAKCPGIAAGIDEAAFLLKQRLPYLKGRIIFTPLLSNGNKFEYGKILAELEGRASDILAMERTLLNFIQRMCGIATLTNVYVKKVPNDVLITGTRKTLWGALDKKAIVAGGGGTHRMNLSDAILIKDNHISLLKGDLRNLLDNLSRSKIKGRFIEIEVTNVKQANEVIDLYGRVYRKRLGPIPFILMFDNFKPADIRKVIKTANKGGYYDDIFFEASGGINSLNIAEYAASGVDILSCGTLTHSAPSLDISLEITG